MIKWPEPFLVRHEDVCGDEVGPPTPCYTEAQLKQAVRDFGEHLAKHFGAMPGREMFGGEIEDEIRELIKEIPT